MGREISYLDSKIFLGTATSEISETQIQRCYCIAASCSVCSIDETREGASHGSFGCVYYRSKLALVNVVLVAVSITPLLYFKLYVGDDHRACSLMFKSQQPDLAKVCMVCTG